VDYRNHLEEGVFLKRYKRFFADVQWNAATLVAHVPNTGSLKGVNTPGQPCLFSHSDNPLRKLKQTLEMIQAQSGCWVGVNTATPNAVVREALESVILVPTSGPMPERKILPAWSHWAGFDSVKPEFKISAETRLDFALAKAGTDRKHFIEVKSVTMAEGKTAMFPDSETLRGQKHLQELIKLVDEGHTAEIVFAIQREDCDSFAPAGEIDSEYARLLREAERKGVRITPLVVALSRQRAMLTTQVLSLRF
jgi:sugar fermentation stimulation protein A